MLTTNRFDPNDENANIRVHKHADHNHAADSEMVQQDSVRHAMKQAVRADPSRPVKRAYDGLVVDVRRGDGLGGITVSRRLPLPEFHRVRSCLGRAKRETVPPIPRAIDEVDITGQWATTWSSERFLQFQDNDWGIAVFATDKCLKVMALCTDLYVDGTFRSTPRPYYQYVTILGKYRDRVLNLASCLLTGKTIGHYRQLFQCLKLNVRRLTHHRLQPRRVMCDFEQALVTALETEFLGVRVSGCYFHFCQSLHRHIQELGLVHAYMHDEDLKKIARKFMSLEYLPVALVCLYDVL
jgi:hypothetical protein